MNLIYNYLVHCLLLLSSKILLIVVLFPYSYYLTLSPLSLPLSSSPALSPSLLLPPCHHHHYNYRYWYIFVTQPITIFPQTSKYRLRNSGYSGYPITFYLVFFFCSCLLSPQMSFINGAAVWLYLSFHMLVRSHKWNCLLFGMQTRIPK